MDQPKQLKPSIRNRFVSSAAVRGTTPASTTDISNAEVSKRRAAWCFLALLFANLGGALWVAFSSTRFIASNTGLVGGGAYALLSGALIWSLGKRVGTKRKGALLVSLVMGSFGFLAISQGAAFVYTFAIGVTSEHRYTVHSSYLQPSWPRWDCPGYYRTQLSGVIWLAIGNDALCTRAPIPVGRGLTVSGPESLFGQVASHIKIEPESKVP